MRTPFNAIILGMTSCGKTFYLLQLLETDYKNHFEKIFLICPTFVHNKTYQEWKYVNDEDFIVIPCDQDDVEYHLRQVTHFAEGTNSLIILDDCACSQAIKNRTSELVKLGFSARHYGLSTIVITQQLTSIAKTVQGKYFQARNFLQSERKGHEHDIRRLLVNVGQL